MPLELVRDWVRGQGHDTTARNRDEQAFLPAALEIIETPASPVGRVVALTLAAATIIAIGWACIGETDIIATAPGRIIPVGNTKIIQPTEIGQVKAIHVNDGDHISAGQVLVEIDPVQARAESDRYGGELVHAELALAGLRGLWSAASGRGAPQLTDLPANATPADLAEARGAMVSRYDEQAAAVADLDQQMVEKQALVDADDNSVAKLEASLPLVQQQADLRAELLKQQYTSKLAYLQAQQAATEQGHEIDVLKSEGREAAAEKQALASKRRELISTYEKTLLEDLDKAQTEVTDLQAGNTKAQDSLAAKTLTAPVAGTVQDLAIHTVGGVVTPAQSLMVVVPDDGGLMVEATVNNRDIGFIHEGQKARVKIDTFNFTRYGLIDGDVIGISRDSVTQTEQDASKKLSQGKSDGATPTEPVYVARIRLSRNWMQTESGRVQLGPGMSVTAEIQTGKRRIIEYLLSPLSRHVKNSLHER